MAARTRGAVNEVVPGLVYQRAQVLTWTRERKRALFEAYRVGWVVNFWPKLDPDLADLPIRGYLYLPLPASAGVIQPYIVEMADHVAGLASPSSTVLVLCEAGKTRSVVFSALLARRLLGLSGPDALEHINRVVNATALKPGMVAFLNSLEAP